MEVFKFDLEVFLFPKHGKYFLCFKVLLFIFFTMLFSILLLPMSSSDFCCVWKLVLFWIFFRDSLTDSMFQFFRIILLMFGNNRLHVIAKETRVRIDLSFSSADGFVFYIFWCKVCCFWYTPLHPKKKYWFLKFCTQI